MARRLTKKVRGAANDIGSNRRYSSVPGSGPRGPMGKGKCQKCGGNHMTKNCPMKKGGKY